MKIRILTQNPFSVGFGWVEQQATKYIENIKKIDSTIDISFFSWTEKDFDILHIIWIHSWINPYWIEVLKEKWVKIVVSSVFYLKPNYLFDFRRPIVYKIFSIIPHHIVNWMKKLIINADLILPNSTDEALQLQEVFWVNKEKINILYNWVDKDYFNWINKDLFKNTYNLDNYILCVSHIEPRKNHLNLIKWFLQFKKNNVSDLKLVLLWDFRWNYFKYHDEVKNLINNNKDSIFHINNLKNTDELFKSSYLWAKSHFLLSSLETPGLSNIESAYAWNKLILWDCNPVKEYFKDYAMYINPQNLDEIEQNIKNILSNNWIQNKQIEFIKKNYTWEEISKQLLTYYKNLWIKK